MIYRPINKLTDRQLSKKLIDTCDRIQRLERTADKIRDEQKRRRQPDL